MTFENYHTESFYDEMFLPDGSPRPEARQLVERIEGLPDGELVRRHQTAERSLLHTGITFTVYGDEAGTERIFPFDIVPRIVSRETWDPIERGLKQRVEALNLFIDDVYHDRKIVRDGVVPADVIESSQGYRTECIGIDPPAADDVGKPIDGLQWGGSARRAPSKPIAGRTAGWPRGRWPASSCSAASFRGRCITAPTRPRSRCTR